MKNKKLDISFKPNELVVKHSEILKVFFTIFLILVLVSIFFGRINPLYSKDKSYDTNEMYKDWESVVYLGEEYELNELEEKIIALIQKDPNDVFLYYLMSCLYLRKASISSDGVNTGSLLRKSMELTQHIIELSPEIDLGYVSMARSFAMVYQKEQAKQLVEEAMFVIDDPSWRMYFTLSFLSLENKDYAKAKKYGEQALSFRHSNLNVLVPYFIDVLKLYYDENMIISSSKENKVQMDKYLKELYTWNKVYPHSYFWEEIAKVLISRKEYKKAHAYLEKVHSKEYRNSISSYMTDAQLLSENLKDYKKATAFLNKVISYRNIEHYQDVKALAYMYLGDIELRSKNIDKAEHYFKEALLKTEFPTDIFMSTLISQIHDSYKKHNDLKNFSTLLEEVLEERFLSENVYMYLAHLYSEELKNYEKALVYINDAIVLDIKRGDFYNEAGLIYYRMNDLNGASAMLSLAIELNPVDAIARYNYACVLSMGGHIKEAFDSLEKAIMLKPDLYKFSLTDKDLTNLMNDPVYAGIKDPNASYLYSNTGEENIDVDIDTGSDDLDFIDNVIDENENKE